MQRLGKNTLVIETYVGDDHTHLHRTPAGFQFGFDESTQIVTEISEVSGFKEDVQAQVQRWLDEGGVKKAKRAQLDIEVAENANKAPGTLDAMAEQLGPEVKAQMFNLMKQALAGSSLDDNPVTAPEGGSVKKIDGGVLVSKPGENTEFVPESNVGDPETDQPETDQLDLVPAGAQNSEMTGQLKRTKGKGGKR